MNHLIKQSAASIIICLGLSVSAATGANTGQTKADEAVVTPVQSSGADKKEKLATLMSDKPVYLKFWASWCQPCRKEMPHLAKVESEYGEAIDVISVNIGINETDATIDEAIDKYGLTMPTVIDSQGDLKRLFDFQGTPYHVVLNNQGNAVYSGYSADDEKLDTVLQQFAAGKVAKKSSDTPDETKQAATGGELPEWLNEKGPQAVLYTAEWCDWYLADTRPEMAKTCTNAQKRFNELASQVPSVQWRVVLSPLWTSEDKRVEYKEKHKIDYSVVRDAHNVLFDHFGVKNFPTIYYIEDGKLVATYEGDDYSVFAKKIASGSNDVAIAKDR